jgi:outer membrane protein W
MKYIYTLILLFFLHLQGFSQTEKKSWLIGGSANGAIHLNTYKYYSYGIAPQVGYFLFNNFAVGLTPYCSFGYYSNSKSSAVGIGPFLRYYLGKSKVRFFIEAGSQYSFQNILYKNFQNIPPPNDNLKIKDNTWNENISAGAVYFITKNIGLEAKVQFSYAKTKSYSNSAILTASSPNPNSYLFIRVGFQIYVPAKEKKAAN